MFSRIQENCDFKILVKSLKKEVKDISDNKRTMNRKTVTKKIAEIFTTSKNFCPTHIIFAFMTSLRKFYKRSSQPLSLMKSLELLNDVISLSEPIFHVFIHMPDWGIFALEKAALAKMREISNGKPLDHTFDINFDRFNYTSVSQNKLQKLQKHLEETSRSVFDDYVNITSMENQTMVDWKQSLVKFDRDYYKRQKKINERIAANDAIFTSSEGISYNYENLKQFKYTNRTGIALRTAASFEQPSLSFICQASPNKTKIASSPIDTLPTSLEQPSLSFIGQASPNKTKIASSPIDTLPTSLEQPSLSFIGQASPNKTEIASSPIDTLPTSLEQPSLSFNDQSSENRRLNMYKIKNVDSESGINDAVYLQADNFSNQNQSSHTETQSPQIPENSAISQNPKDSILAKFNEGKEVKLQRMKKKLESDSLLKPKSKPKMSINGARFGSKINLKRA